jgi:hypothetical protein
MIERGPAAADEMVLAFLKAEIDSPRFSDKYLDILSQSGLGRALLIDHADPGNPRDNRLRTALLQLVRGYGGDKLLFAGFPPDVRWRRADLEPGELSRLKYANFRSWAALTRGSRRVIDGARNIDIVPTADNSGANIKAVVEQLRRGRRYSELIVVEGPQDDLIIVEGHTRATAYVLDEHAEPIPLLVGTSRLLHQWVFY